MVEANDSPLVGTAWLAEHLDDPGLRVVDVRWRSRIENGRGVGYDDEEGYLAGHIPGAVFVPMAGEIADPEHPVPDMLVPPDRFAAVMGRLGVGNDSLVVAYDDMGQPQGAARLWWALSYYGHDRVRVLDGGLRQWRREGRPLSTEVPKVAPTRFVARPRPDLIAGKADVVAALGDPDSLIIDCLSPEQFRGDTGGNLWGARPGHIPGAVNVPAIANLDPDLAQATFTERQRLLESDRPLLFADRDTLRALYAAAGLTPGREVITYCGRGYAAACGLLALKLLGHERVRLYDGGLSEWTADPGLPVETGG